MSTHVRRGGPVRGLATLISGLIVLTALVLASSPPAGARVPDPGLAGRQQADSCFEQVGRPRVDGRLPNRDGYHVSISAAIICTGEAYLSPRSDSTMVIWSYEKFEPNQEGWHTRTERELDGYAYRIRADVMTTFSCHTSRFFRTIFGRAHFRYRWKLHGVARSVDHFLDGREVAVDC